MKPKESKYLRTLVILLCMLGVVQGLLQNYEVRRLLNESIRLEGEPLARAVSGLKEPANPWLVWPPPDENEPLAKKAFQFYLKFVGGSDASVWILVNGKAVKRITRDDGSFYARDHDLIEVAVESGWASLVITSVERGVTAPKEGTWVKGEGVMLLGRVRYKEPSTEK